MDIKQAYDVWAHQYDLNKNKTRDLEAISLRSTLKNLSFDTCLEIGCGTGKNSQYLITKVNHLSAVDLSKEMLAKAKDKVISEKVAFIQADINNQWDFVRRPYDLVVFSLVLEHIEELADIFKKAAAAIAPGGYIYIGELHPFKQYMGTKARFDTELGQQVLTCFTHHISDFTQAAKSNGLQLVELQEFFDEDEKNSMPRILTMLFKKGENHFEKN